MKRILPIISFILLIAIQSQGQSARIASPVSIGDPVVKLYPNPAITYITFEIQTGFDKGLSIQVYSFLGKKMYESQNLAQKLTVDLTEFNRGLYMYHLLDAAGKIIKSGKFQVTK